MTGPNNTKNFQALSDGTLGPFKNTWQGGHVKDYLSYTGAKIDKLLQLMEHHFPVGTQ